MIALSVLSFLSGKNIEGAKHARYGLIITPNWKGETIHEPARASPFSAFKNGPSTGRSVTSSKRLFISTEHSNSKEKFMCSMTKQVLPIAVLLALAGGPTYAADPVAENSTAPAKSADEIARELANPNNSLASLTFKNQYRWYDGDLPNADKQGNYTLLFQPVFPFPLADTASGGKANLFIRPAIPVLVDQPVYNPSKADFDGKSALGDIGFDIGYGVTEKSGLLWAAGVVGTLPTATKSDVAGKQLRLGPEVLFAKFEKWGVYGLFPSHQWNVTGWSDNQYSTSQLQLFLKFLPGGGWNIGTAPIMNYDWRTHDWTIPLNLGASKTLKWGSTPVKVELELNYYVEKPDAFGPEWMVSLNFTPVVRNFINDWVRGR